MNKGTQIVLLRGGLLIAYLLAALFVAAFFGAAGHGSYAPGAILFGWGIVPWQLEIVRGGTGFFLVPMLYLLCFLALASLIPRSVIPLGLHTGGVVVAVMNLQHSHVVERGWLAMSYIVSLAVAMGFIWCDQRLLRRRGLQEKP